MNGWLTVKVGNTVERAKAELKRLLPDQNVRSHYFKYRERWGRSIYQGALFPGYMFVTANDNARVMSIIDDCYYVFGALTMNGLPCALEDETIQFWQQREDREGFIWLTDQVLGFANDSRVRITAGPFVGYAGVVKGMLPHERVNVLIRIFNRSTPIAVPVEDLIAA